MSFHFLTINLCDTKWYALCRLNVNIVCVPKSIPFKLDPSLKGEKISKLRWYNSKGDVRN